MQSLKTLLAVFEPPKLTPEQKASAAEWERRERRRIRAERLGRACVPPMFRAADIRRCDAKVQRYSASLSPMGGRECAYGASSSDLGKGLVLQGKVGRGKTYSACAVLLDHLEDYPVRFATMQGILRDIQGAFNGVERMGDVMGRYRNVRLLVIDDFGKEQPTKWSLPVMFEIIDGRYSQCKPTIFTTQYRGIELAKRLTVDDDRACADAIISRMATCETVIMNGENRRSSCMTA